MWNRLKMKEPVNTWTHFVTCIAAVIGLVLLIRLSYESTSTLITMVIYGVSLILLYAASSIYHWVRTTPKKELWLKKLDHCAIYLLIAGSYTPVFYHGLDGVWKWVMLLVIWVMSIIGIVLKLFFIHLPRYLSTAFYVTLGWIAVIPFVKLVDALPLGAIILMIVGGMLYTIGSIIYATKIFDFFPQKFGFHEIFHLFVTAGSVVHFIMMVQYIIPLGIN